MTEKTTIVIGSGIESFSNDQIQQAIQENVQQLEGNYTLLSVPDSLLMGAYFSFNDPEQYQAEKCLVEIFNEHQYIDCFNPRKPNIFILPKEWVDLSDMAPRSYVEVEVAVDKIMSLDSPNLSDLDAEDFYIHIFGASIQAADQPEEWDDDE